MIEDFPSPRSRPWIAGGVAGALVVTLLTPELIAVCRANACTAPQPAIVLDQQHVEASISTVWVSSGPLAIV